MLPDGMTLEQASSGFRNQGQFIAALNASKNRGLPFADLQKAMTVDGMSLGQAAKTVKAMPPAVSSRARHHDADDGHHDPDDGHHDADHGHDDPDHGHHDADHGHDDAGGSVEHHHQHHAEAVSETPMTRRVLPFARFALIVAGLWLVTPATGLAQGNGNGTNGRPKAPKADKPASTPSPSPSPSPSRRRPRRRRADRRARPRPRPPRSTGRRHPRGVSRSVHARSRRFRQFGSWLDDASAATPGEGQTSVGIGHWRMNGMTQTNFPMIGMGIGVTDRLQVSASLPFYHASYDGVVARGIDDIYMSAKYVLVDPTLTLSEVGLAVSPVVEVLSAGAPDGRVHFALPVNVEVRRLPFRVYGSAGYFTRGSVFAGGALEWTSSSRITFTGALTQSYSTRGRMRCWMRWASAHAAPT